MFRENKNKTGIKPSVLIIGGTSGLGLAIARLLHKEGHRVLVAGRKNPHQKGLAHIKLSIGSDTKTLSIDADRIVKYANPIDLFVYAAGFFQKGTLDKLDDAEIKTMVNVGLLAPALILHRILCVQKKLPGIIAITSTSQWIPRREEPVYASVKAGLAMLGHSVSLDSKIGKTLVVGPAGMDTKMLAGRKRAGTLLNVNWVGEEIIKLYKNNFKFKLVRILRDPPRIELVE